MDLEVRVPVGVTEALPAIGLFLLVLGYATVLTLGDARPAKAVFMHSLLDSVGEMPDPFYRH